MKVIELRIVTTFIYKLYMYKQFISLKFRSQTNDDYFASKKTRPSPVSNKDKSAK